MNSQKPDLSIIIVGFNAIEFLRLTLEAVEKAIANISAEVILIDNSNNQQLQSTVHRLHPLVKILPNTENLGFAKANNLGLKAASGRLAVLLNPDTLVAEDTFEHITNYYSQHPDTGGLGVKMHNGSGSYLKESKRGFPNLRTSFFKLSGLHKLFPHSKQIARYYLGHLNNTTTNKVDVLSGAFLVIPRDNNDDFTLLDESYFMYGEDIDLSCRLKAKHGNNVYFPQTTILHFKGQSTNVNPTILWNFHHSMWLFYKQYLNHQHSALTNNTVKLLVRTITHLHIFANKWLRKPKAKSDLLTFKSIRLVSEGEELAHALNAHFNAKIESSLNKPAVSSDNALIIFDFTRVCYKQAIDRIENYPGNYGFLLKGNSALIICTPSGGKGQVIHLK